MKALKLRGMTSSVIYEAKALGMKVIIVSMTNRINSRLVLFLTNAGIVGDSFPEQNVVYVIRKPDTKVKRGILKLYIIL